MEDKLDNRLKELRVAAGLKQEDVAAGIDVSISHYSDMERGAKKVSDKWIKRLSEFYNIDPWQIFSSIDNVIDEKHAAVFSLLKGLPDESINEIIDFIAYQRVKNGLPSIQASKLSPES